ncbi:MAG: tRNA (adenosine(37)-N6)-dimethylallyltransferase MiaA [Pseudomonadota bacterium]
MAQLGVILIAGPTASGKSALATTLAERAGGVVVNADSMQVYRELQLLTARPSAADEMRVPHRLYGHIPASDAYSAGRFAKDAQCVIAEAWRASQIPIIVGGTGLYFSVLLDGLSPVPAIPADIRAQWRETSERLDGSALHEELARVDPVMARRLPTSDRQRIVRALEVITATGRSLASWQSEPGAPVVPRESPVLPVVVTRERAEIYARCDARFAKMVEMGALDEVRRLLALELDPGLPAMRALGVRPLARHLTGQIDLDTAISQGQTETRNYVKRQLTWLRRNMIAWNSINLSEMNSSEALSFLNINEWIDRCRRAR